MATAAIDRSATAKAGVRGVERFAWAVVGYNVLVVLWGALVRATESGAGCGNNWPLCNGVAIPVSPTLHTIIEFTHRQMVTGDVIAVVALLVWTFRASIKGAAARVFAVASTLLLINEAFLGALLVKLGYVTGNRVDRAGGGAVDSPEQYAVAAGCADVDRADAWDAADVGWARRGARARVRTGGAAGYACRWSQREPGGAGGYAVPCCFVCRRRWRRTSRPARLGCCGCAGCIRRAQWWQRCS